MTQTQKILKFLRSGKKLTPLSALKFVDCLSLSQRCGDLVKAGHKIKKQWVRLSNGKRVMSYYL